MRNLLGTSDVNAYLVMMTARLVELHRVLKPTGSLYLHCDPTASHYLKIMLDAIFGPRNFRREIVWRSGWVSGFKARAKNWVRNHDTILYYFKDEKAAWTFNKDTTYTPHPEGYKRRGGGENTKGVALDDVWTDIYSPGIMSFSQEKLGYPTQKPVALLERIIAASSNVGDIVLDPFCGCGTAIDAAHKLGRRWIGIDITYLAVDLIRKRLRHTYGDEIEASYMVHGVPADAGGAAALFAENPFDFERWAVSLIDAQPNEKQVGDKGIDGRVRFHADEGRIGQALVSVKGGGAVNPGMVRDLRGTIEREGAEMGILITVTDPTKGMREEADKSGLYTASLTGQSFPKIQIVSVADLMAGKRPKMPTAILPYLKAKPSGPDQLTLGG